MIDLDTNMLLGLWLDDDPAQDRRIDALVAEHGRAPGALRVTAVVLAEAMGTLQWACGRDQAAQLLASRSLPDEETALACDERELVERAVARFEQAPCGFSHGLIARRHARQDGDVSATLGRRMRCRPGVLGDLTRSVGNPSAVGGTGQRPPPSLPPSTPPQAGRAARRGFRACGHPPHPTSRGVRTRPDRHAPSLATA